MDPLGLRAGMRVSVTPDDYGRDPVEGELVTLSLHEVARQLRMSVKTASRRIAAGDFPPHIKLGRLVLFRRQAVTEWLRSRESATGIVPRKRTRRAKVKA